MKRAVLAIILSVLLGSAFAPPALAVSPSELKEAIDSMAVLLSERTGVEGKLELKRAVRRGSELDLFFDYSLGDFPWRDGDVDWFRATMKSLLPGQYRSLGIGKVTSRGTRLEDLPTPGLRSDGRPSHYRYRYDDRNLRRSFVRREGAPRYSGGLSGRNIALWQSHGRYFDTDEGEWRWQRPPVHTTVEDMYTQSYVLPFLIPMLENAGAYVMTPRERDIQRYEVIIDNDASFPGERPLPLRQKGIYSESGAWNAGGAGFADTKMVYMLDENPFIAGTTRKTGCARTPSARASWSFKVPERGSYAVYVSYESLPSSTPCARYTIRHQGGETVMIIDQRKGGGTWIYLGSFSFRDGGSVTLDNGTPASYDFEGGRTVSADAVKIGGGMGKIARGCEEDDQSEYSTSGLPAFAEGALYSMQWAGIDTSVTGKWEGEYTRDFASRGAWVSHISAGSESNPEEKGKGIPVDMSLGFHSDAGITPNDSTIGTLAIYTLLCEKKDKLPDGKNRAIGRHYADLVQSQIVSDVRAQYDTSWRRRWVWDRSYSESRTTGVPGMLLEVLSHQNFADMRYGLDPSFRFTVSRSVYKGMLKFLADIYGKPYVVQPLPVSSFSVGFAGPGQARLVWKAVEDECEPTASPERYILYTRIDDGVFDDGKIISEVSPTGDYLRTTVPIEPGHIYSFRIAAENDGGRSFPSETLCIGSPASESMGTVLIVNNFDRVSAPAWFDSPGHAGFETWVDAGVPWMYDISFAGRNYEFRREAQFGSNDDPGFGASLTDKAGNVIAGNSFDYPYLHGCALLNSGYAFQSAGRDGYVAVPTLAAGTLAIDLICGKQISVRNGTGSYPDRFCVFPASLREALDIYCEEGGNLIVSGSYIAKDAWSSIYPIEKSEEQRNEEKEFIKKTLGLVYGGGFGSLDGSIVPDRNRRINLRPSLDTLRFWNAPNSVSYCAENPDALKCAEKVNASVIMRYADTRRGAAVCFDGAKHKSVSFGFPLETVKDPEQMRVLLESSLEYFRR